MTVALAKPASRHSASAAGPLAGPRVPPRATSRELILDAAEAVVLAAGAAHMTIESVAERAGVSKGGLLYHFPSKVALLQAMIDRHMRRIDADHAAALAQAPAEPGRDLKAFIRMVAEKYPREEKRLGCAMLAASANNPKLLEPLHRFHRWRKTLLDAAARDGLPFERVAVASLAADGLCFLEMLQLSPFSAAQRERIFSDISCLLDETTAAQKPRAA